MKEYLLLFASAMMPVLAAAGLFLLQKKTAFGRVKGPVRQLITGLLFGLLAVLGTRWGIPIEGATMNTRDAAVLTAGLYFGGPAGILAGLIGGAYRWVASAWGAGLYARNACVISTVFAGFVAALLRRFIFEKKRPSAAIATAVGVVMELFHFTMVFLTNIRDPQPAVKIVRTCLVPMLLATGISLMLTSLILTLLAGEKISLRPEKRSISQIIQNQLMVLVAAAFILATWFSVRLQERIADEQTDATLSLAIKDVKEDIGQSTDDDLLRLAYIAKAQYGTKPLKEIAEQLKLTEINIVDEKGIITESTYRGYIGFDMGFGFQSTAFLCLLGETEEYVQDYGPISYEDDVYRKYAGIKLDKGFLQVGYDAEQFQSNIDSQIRRAAMIHHVGEEGGILILDRNMIIVSATEETVVGKSLAGDTSEKLPGTDVTFVQEVEGEPCFVRYSMAEGYYIVAILPQSEAQLLRNTALFANGFAEIQIFVLLFGMVFLLIRNTVVRQTQEVTGTLSRIASGDLDVAVDVRSSLEFAKLSNDINATVDTLKRYISEASARIDAELEFARNIQASALPKQFPAFPRIKQADLYALMDPAKEVGGDFYDYYLTGGNTPNFVIADVSGKGIGAAMFMMRAMTQLRGLTQAGRSVDEVFTRANAALCEGNDANMFVTAWEGSLDPDSGAVTFANAGHNPPLILHEDGSCAFLRAPAGFILAGMDGMVYWKQETVLARGDVLILYTDGVTEAMNEAGKLYGEERLMTAAAACRGMTAKEICERIRADVEAFADGAPQADDITLLALKYFGEDPLAELRIEKAQTADIERVTAFLETELDKLEVPLQTVMKLSIVVDEIFSNIVKYGYPEGGGPVTVSLMKKSTPRGVSLRFEDEGIPYDPLEKEDPDISRPAEERKVGGLGVFVVKKIVDDVKYRYENGKNILTLTKNW